MTDDLRALLAAIADDPADDTVRLAYADCLDEHDNHHRADFIRLQIEAERLHPDSNARADLEKQAEALFAELWTAWWGEVCAAVGFPPPVPEVGFLGRIARRAGFSPGANPYHRDRFAVRWDVPAVESGYVRELSGVEFRRGFPEAVHFTLAPPPGLQAWRAASPLAALTCDNPMGDMFDDGPHLAGVRSLTLSDHEPAVLLIAMRSPHFARLEELRLCGHEARATERELLPDELAWLVESPRTRQLKRLGIPVWTDRTADALAAAENLAALEGLEILLPPAGTFDRAAAGARLATLARSPHLAGLRELKVVGGLEAGGVEAAVRNPTWTGLRKIDLDVAAWHDPLVPLLGADGLPELDEFRLSGMRYDAIDLTVLANSPLLKRLRHFAVRGRPGATAEFDVAYAVDAGRIETFAIAAQDTFPRVVAMLRDRFGDRLRLLE